MIGMDLQQDAPIPAELSGRDARGRFTRGNPGGRGNPLNRRVQAMRSAIIRATTYEDVVAVLRKLHALALEGDVQAAALYLDRCLGKVAQAADGATGDAVAAVPTEIVFTIVDPVDVAEGA